MKTRRTALASSLLLAASLGLTACGSGGSGSGDSNTVTIWSSVDPPVKAGLEKELKAKLAAAGKSAVKIKWDTVTNINQVIITKIQAGSTPDIAFIPQPGVVAQMQQLNAIKPLDSMVDMSSLKSSMVPGSLDAGTIDGKLYGLLVSANVKGLLFYNKPAWTKAGWKAPASIPELESLVGKMKAKGSTAPFCMGIGADTATGWPATDWFETLFMKYFGADAYNKWISHDIKFDSPQVHKVADEFAQLLFTKGNTYGGQDAITSNGFDTAGNGLFTNPPNCWMYNQGSFITGFFPKDVQKNLDQSVGVFGFPPATAGGDNPVEGGGDMMTVLNDTKNVEMVAKMLSQTDIGVEAAPTSSFISPHKDFDVSKYPNDLTRSIAKVLYGTTSFLFDASDAMPAQVGAGAEWKELTAWISGQEDINTALKQIDQAWPAS
ncbi:MAG: ABC transporter substrate-binding protein [Marmoricola sp.]